MRLTIEQLRAGARESRNTIALSLCDSTAETTAWTNFYGGGGCCCPGQAMYALSVGVDPYIPVPVGPRQQRAWVSPEEGSRNHVYYAMSFLLAAAQGVPQDWTVGSRTHLSDIADIFETIVAAAELTEKRAAQAVARAQEFSVREEQKVILAEEAVLV